MTSELPDAVLVDLAAPDRLLEWLPADGQSWGQHERDVSEVLGILDAIAERASARAEQDAELAKFKALAETLAGALEPLRNAAEAVADSLNTAVMNDAIDKADKALHKWEEARDAS